MEKLLSQYHRSLLFLFLCYSLGMPTFGSLALTQRGLLCHEDERSALLQFKQSFVVDCSKATYYDQDGYPYANKPKVASWKENELANNSNSNHRECCTWDGVRCDEITGHIMGLDLGGSCLYGSFPQNSTLFKLTHLRHLNLGRNNFKRSNIPQGFGQLLNLISLNLSMSRFSGQIPLEISRLSNLRALDLSSSSGSSEFYSPKLLKLHNPNLQTLLNNLTRLNKLALDLVDISSTTAPIAIHLSNRTSLRQLSLFSTNLIGEFPSSIFLLPYLEHLDISYNDYLTGALPEFQRNDSGTYKLRVLGLARTGFLGNLPASLGDCLTNLNSLNLHSSKFTGEVPSSFVNLTRLHKLSFTSSTITITPTFFTTLSRLNEMTSLGISSVHFLEPTTFPPCLRNMTKLEKFAASSCQFMGPVPPWLSNLTYLRQLDLSYSNLSSIHVITFIKLIHLKALFLNGISLVFPPFSIIHNETISSNILQLHTLELGGCNITKFPEFLKYQHELIYLDLSYNHIHGLIPHWLGNISKDTLKFLLMSGNNLTGFEQLADSPFILPWKNLQYLYLHYNNLQGSIPTPPISLLLYDLENNSLTENIPESICNTSLQFLDLSNNELSGQIPKCFEKLGDSLVALNLGDNKLQGMIPQNFSKSCTLKSINLNNNQLEGKLPRSLANCLMLQLLDIGNNAINDIFPSWLGNLQAFEVLVLRHNHFHGAVLENNPPISNDDFLNLHIIDLSNNFFTGCLPIEFIQNRPAMRNTSQELHYMGLYATQYMKDKLAVINLNFTYTFSTTSKGSDTIYFRIPNILKLIDLSCNNFTGKISGSIGNLKELVGINFSNNDLTGEIPSSLAYITALQFLDLSHNKLFGEIPHDLVRISSLEIFNVSHNNLMGPIPYGNQFDTFDNSSFEGNRRLCGNPLLKRCEDTGNHLPSSTQEENYDKEEALDWVDWLVILLGWGSGLVVGFVGGKMFTSRHHEWFVEAFRRI